MSESSPLVGIRGCIFDFDGTIVLSEHVHMKAWEDLAQSLGRDLPEYFLEQSVGMSDQQLVKILASSWNHILPENDILIRKRDFYMLRCPQEASVVPGVISVIQILHNLLVPLSIATSSSRHEVEPILSRLDIAKYFKGVCTVEDIKQPKPDPEIYICAASRLGLKPNQCIAFEDSIAGVTSARAAGCALVTVQTLYDEARLGPAIMSIKDFTDLRLGSILSAISR